MNWALRAGTGAGHARESALEQSLAAFAAGRARLGGVWPAALLTRLTHAYD